MGTKPVKNISNFLQAFLIWTNANWKAWLHILLWASLLACLFSLLTCFITEELVLVPLSVNVIAFLATESKGKNETLTLDDNKEKLYHRNVSFGNKVFYMLNVADYNFLSHIFSNNQTFYLLLQPLLHKVGLK